MKIIKFGLIICLFAVILVFFSGCLSLTVTESYQVNKDAQITHAFYNLTMDRSTYNMLKMYAEDKGYSSVKDVIEANLSKNIGSQNASYNEIWDTQNGKVTVSVERTDIFTPSPDSNITIQKKDGMIEYEDLSFYSPKALEMFTRQSAVSAVHTTPTPLQQSFVQQSGSTSNLKMLVSTPTPVQTKWVWNENRRTYEEVEVTPTPENPLFNATEEQEMLQMMLSGISVDYYLEMPGPIVNSTAQTVNDNKAEWHFGGKDIMNTRIYAECKTPAIPGFTSVITILGLFMAGICTIWIRKK